MLWRLQHSTVTKKAGPCHRVPGDMEQPHCPATREHICPSAKTCADDLALTPSRASFPSSFLVRWASFHPKVPPPSLLPYAELHALIVSSHPRLPPSPGLRDQNLESSAAQDSGILFVF